MRSNILVDYDELHPLFPRLFAMEWDIVDWHMVQFGLDSSSIYKYTVQIWYSLHQPLMIKTVSEILNNNSTLTQLRWLEQILLCTFTVMCLPSSATVLAYTVLCFILTGENLKLEHYNFTLTQLRWLEQILLCTFTVMYFLSLAVVLACTLLFCTYLGDLKLFENITSYTYVNFLSVIYISGKL
jgi:hypothetical protein